MANNIVQLQDKNSDNLFPIAGGMAANSITTQMVQDGAVTTAKIANNAVTSDKVDFTTYSSSEQVIGTWTNGKPVYRRVYTGTTGTSGATVVSSSSIGIVVNVGGNLVSAAGYKIPFNFYNSSSSYASIAVDNANQIDIYHSSNFNSSSYTAIVEYTKTTD